jgi:hypothetical protein
MRHATTTRALQLLERSTSSKGEKDSDALAQSTETRWAHTCPGHEMAVAETEEAAMGQSARRTQTAHQNASKAEASLAETAQHKADTTSTYKARNKQAEIASNVEAGKYPRESVHAGHAIIAQAKSSLHLQKTLKSDQCSVFEKHTWCTGGAAESCGCSERCGC